MQLREMLADSMVKDSRINQESKWKYYKVLSFELVKHDKFKERSEMLIDVLKNPK